ncbi:MAG: CHAT domain-containing protein [Bacteroidetes bacterium]|nr:CHAT domain-containing protein [Bacteroidota bacterium]
MITTVSPAAAGADTLRAAALKDRADAFYAAARYDSAAAYYKEAADQWTNRYPLSYVSSVVGAANALVRLGQYSPAYELLRTAEPTAAQLPPQHASVNGTFLLMIGYCLQNREQLDDAEAYALRSLEVLTSTSGIPQERIASAHYTLGGIRKSKGKYPDAVASFTAAATIQRTLPDSFSFALAGTLILLGAVHDDMNAFDTALDYYGQAVAIHRRLGKDATTQAATCYLSMMSTYTNMADYRSAAEMGQKVLDIYYGLGLQYHANMASALGKFAEVYANIGDLEKAEEYFLRALDIFTEYHPHKRSAIGNMNQRLGDLYMRMGKIPKAVEHAERGVRMYEEALGAAHPQTGFMYELMAGVYQAAGRMDEAIGMYHRSIIARSAVPNAASRFDIAMAHSSIAAVYLATRELDSARKHLDLARSYDSLSAGYHILQRAVLFQRFGDYYDRKKDYDRSLEMYQRSIAVLSGDSLIASSELVPSCSGTPYPTEVAGILASKARVLERRFRAIGKGRDLAVSLEHLKAAMDLSEESRKRFTAEGSKLHTAAASLALYRNACRIALELNGRTGDPGYKNEAFLIADRSKGNVLLERLFENDARRFAGVPESLLTYERHLLSELSRQERRISEMGSTQGSADRGQAAEQRSRYFRTKLEHQHFIRMLEQQFPRYHALKYADNDQSIERIQQQLSDSAALVEFMLDGDRIFVFTVTRTDVRVTTLKDVAVLRSMVQRYVQALKTYDASSYTSTGAELYRAVLQPLEPSFAGISRIKFVPDGFLHYLPFETLPLKRYDHRTVPFHTMRYLIHRFDVTYAYSGAVAAKMQENGGTPSVRPRSFVGFAPVFRDTVRNADFLAQRDAVVRSGLTDARSITVDGRTFNELRYSEMEVDAIGRSLRDRSVLTQQYLFADATEENFKQAAPQFDIVHVATHGFINEQNPKYSAIIFSQPAVPGGEDGILYVNETFTLDLKARLVVLSSCESGIGRLVDGEGMIALSRGLFYAGASNIMLSLWKVSDQQTYGLMEPFYRHVAAGEAFPSALRKAKLSMIDRPSSAFPAKWGGFILMGQ